MKQHEPPMYRFTVPAGCQVEVCEAATGEWMPYTTTRASCFHRYEYYDRIRMVFKQGDWLLRAWPWQVLDYYPERRLHRWQLQ